ncbi:hypothetical protein RFI_04925 [Reticulomyxa filosa]|uniref:Reverse transcriptase domain-containing protein n=1 Tax=Reticulomyxa filosa TaxID=46433 RepID=X6P3P2_RETFI|nr:hypothetical protein RFI_04925 [Reticulomyxa filosa]|eukprot:ETO32192.1 hypothetical protein RFI_04925 [Reticulomyxa filosa]
MKKANIVHIPKSDRDHSQCKNHRSIALLSSVDKLMGKELSHKTDELLLRLIITYAVLLDISAAYDSVWRNGFISVMFADDVALDDGYKPKAKLKKKKKGKLSFQVEEAPRQSIDIVLRKKKIKQNIPWWKSNYPD